MSTSLLPLAQPRATEPTTRTARYRSGRRPPALSSDRYVSMLTRSPDREVHYPVVGQHGEHLAHVDGGRLCVDAIVLGEDGRQLRNRALAVDGAPECRGRLGQLVRLLSVPDVEHTVDLADDHIEPGNDNGIERR